MCSTRRSSSLSAASRERTPSANERGTPGAASDSSTRNGIPSARTLDPGDDLIRGRRQAGAHHGGDLGCGQAAEGQVPGGAATGQPGHQLGSRRRGVTPAGGDAEHGLGGQIVAQVLHDRERVRVGPVQVFEHQEQAGASSETPQQLQHGLAAHRCGVVTATVTLRSRRSWESPPVARAARRQAGVVGKRALAQRLLQRFGQRPVRAADARWVQHGRQAPSPARARASAASSPASRDLPIPASPVRNITPPAPPWAAASADRSRAVSASRPMSTGHSRSVTRSLCFAAVGGSQRDRHAGAAGGPTPDACADTCSTAGRLPALGRERPRPAECVAGYALLPMRLVSRPANDGAKATGPGQRATAAGAGSCQEQERNSHGNRQGTGRALGPRSA